MRKHLLTAAIGAAAIATIAAALAIPASAAQSGASAPANVVVLPGTTRVVPTPGRLLAAGATSTVQVTGTAPGQADPGALGVTVKLTSISPSGTGSLVVYAGDGGAPGNPTVQYTTGAEVTGSTTVRLPANGQLKVTARGASTRFLLSVDVEDLAAAPAPAATTFGIGQLQVDGTTWAQYSAAELGSPVGDMASGTVRFTCKTAAGCDVSLKAYSTADGWTVYPRIVLEKEDNTDGAKLTCEYADGADNNGATAPLTGTATTVPLGIGSTADCGGSQTTVAGPVESINVPGSAGQGVHYDAAVTLTFAPNAG